MLCLVPLVLLSCTVVQLAAVERDGAWVAARRRGGEGGNRRMMLRLDLLEEVRLGGGATQASATVAHLTRASTLSVSVTEGDDAAAAADGAAAASQQAAQAATAPPARHWLYTLVGADYEGAAALLPHWLDHYLGPLEFDPERLLVVVNHNSTRPAAAAEYAAVVRVLRARGIPFQPWLERYSSDAHLSVKLALLARRVRDPQDWITVADSDEFPAYADAAGGGGGTISELTAAAAAAGANYVMGQMVDRVAEGGALEAVRPGPPSVLDQFPLRCGVVRHLSGGSPFKVAAARAYWRTNTGNHLVVTADRARRYFGAAPAGVRNDRGGWLGAEDVWALTPYAAEEGRYWLPGRPARAGQYRPVQLEAVVPVYHVKWHLGVVQSAADRLEYYRGNVTAGEGAGGGGEGGGGEEAGAELPRFNHYYESANILKALQGGRVDVEAAGCVHPDGSAATNNRTHPRR